MEDEDIADIFSKLDVEVAIDDCNFNKAVGIDWFSGKAIKRNPQVRQKVVEVILRWLNECQVPEYVKKGKAVLFSKTGKEVASLGDTRLITVRKHLLKIMEKAVMHKL